MSTFIEECRREWKRLGVPDLIAEEMATDLIADLHEADAEGARPEEVLGASASDPRAFAAAWASEKGVVRPRLRDKVPGRRLVAAGVLLVAILAAILAVSISNSSHPRTKTPAESPALTSTASVRVLDLRGVQEAAAIQLAEAAGLQVSVKVVKRPGTRAGTVLSQAPFVGELVRRGTTLSLVVARP